MGLLASQGLPAEMQALSQLREGLVPIRSGGIGAKNPVESSLHELFEGGFPLGGNDFCAVKQVVGEINSGLHKQHIQLYGPIVKTTSRAWRTGIAS